MTPQNKKSGKRWAPCITKKLRRSGVNLKRSLQVYTPELPKSKAAGDFNFYVIIDS